MKILPVIAIIVVIAFLIMTAFPFFSFASPLPDDGLSVSDLDTDIQGKVSNYSPKTDNNELPLRAQFVSDEQDDGHVAWGIFNIQNRYGTVNSIGLDITLNDIVLTDDESMNRIGIVTSWEVDGGYHYLEFDIWDSPETQALPLFDVIHYNLNSDMPTVIVRTDQLAVGENGKYLIDIENQYRKFWSDTDAELYGVYLVVEKTSDSTFYADLTINDLILYGEAI